MLARDVVACERRGPVHAVLLEGSGEIEARAVIVATGVAYRRLTAAGVDDLTGRGIYYGANAADASQCQGDEVLVVGAANSAGQAALNLARYAERVVLVARGPSLDTSMSRYLVARILADPRIEVRYGTEVVAAQGNAHLESVTLSDRATGETEQRATSWLFVFIGAAPRTDWLGKDVARDEHGFVVTGQDLAQPDASQPDASARWPLAAHRSPSRRVCRSLRRG
ncbi:NAD(P)/FAD-dependent oxidoreductase [Nocardioides ungokensis]|uniref:NAD(P)/FAD-dependent oxidoreductase n=1 Tax=Nocardioides ungokensis TaxID=1643322 RepID=UPI001FECD41E|nr:NAD(P)/FAD-dependent oxidoreductase [Nocardioides ungokensis]